MNKNSNFVVSIVIPSYNEGVNLLRCLDSILLSAGPKSDLIVVDDGSFANASAQLKGYPIRLISLGGNFGPAYARNAGVRESKGDVILFTDADCVVMENWAEQFSNSLVEARRNDSRVAAACGRVKSERGFFASCHAFAGYSYVQSSEKRSTEMVNTACMAVFKDSFLSAGGFNEDMRVCEDIDLGLRMTERGFRIVYDPGISVEHHHGIKTFGQLLRRHSEWGVRHGSKVYLLHPRKYRFFLPFLKSSVTHFFSIILFAVLTTFKIIFHNMREHKEVLLYSFHILLCKIVFRWGIFKAKHD